MSSKPKVLFVYDHPRPEWLMDGLWAALNLLEEDFEIERFNLATDGVARGADFYLGWGAFGSRVDNFLQHDKQMDVEGNNPEAPIEISKYGLCIAGNATPTTGAENYDILFYETSWVKDNYLPKHKHTVKAFGINADLFSPPTIPTPIVWDYIGVGAFATWKRWEKMADKTGSRLVVGEYQQGNERESLSIVRELVTSGVMVSPQVKPLDLVNLYYWSRTLYMPSDLYGGGERAVLEALACGLDVEIEKDNPKLDELLHEKIPTHHDYATALKEGILSVL